ncbi:MAG TPA: methyltransferase domain-containing protein [Solimonas sp.]|nr:methyltransferase domain-containing protein [Solimonas sp.]
MSMIVCPLCRQPLARDPKTWRCERGHSFDVAREGYINLLPVQHKHSLDPGDDAQMIAARREFLQTGYYGPLREAVLALLAPLGAQSLLDIGCGEGWYTGALTAVAPEVVGLDIARTAIRLAAKRYPGVTWVVGSGAHMPIADASVDLVANIFTQMHIAEMERVLRTGGHVLLVTPAPQHLRSLREALFEEVRGYDPGKFLAGFEAGFELVSRQEVCFPLALDNAALRQLLQMTPYAWKAKAERRTALEASEGHDSEAAFSLMLLRRRERVEVIPDPEPVEAPEPEPAPAPVRRGWPGRKGSSD